jgi:hypothetical protein
MPRLAFFTFAILRAPRQHPDSASFLAAIDPTNAAAERAEGFLDQTRVDPDTGRHSWGEPVLPSFVAPDDAPQVTRSLSLWQDLETVFAYAYGGQHAESLRQRKAVSPARMAVVRGGGSTTAPTHLGRGGHEAGAIARVGSTAAAFTSAGLMRRGGDEVERHREADCGGEQR